MVRIAGGITEKNTPRNLQGRGSYVVALEQYLSTTRLHDTILDGLRTAVRYDKTYFDKIVASLLPLLEKLTTRKISQLLAPDYGDLNDPPRYSTGSRPFASGRLFMSGWMHCLTQKLPPLSATQCSPIWSASPDISTSTA